VANGINLDQEVDHDQQDHPGLPGPLDTGRLDHGFIQQEEENEADDAVDGRIISHHENKLHDSRRGGNSLEDDQVKVFGVNGEDYDRNPEPWDDAGEFDNQDHRAQIKAAAAAAAFNQRQALFDHHQAAQQGLPQPRYFIQHPQQQLLSHKLPYNYGRGL